MLVRRLASGTAALIAVLVAARVARAQEAPTTEELQEALEALRLEVALRASAAKERERALEARLDEVQADARAARPALKVGKAKVALGAFVQVDAVIVDQGASDELDPSTRQPLNSERVVLRRGRLTAEVDGGVVGAKLELDANTIDGPQVRVIGAEVNARVEWVQAVAGIFRIPFGLETRQTYRERLFLEPSHQARALFPGDYDVGLGLRASWRFVRAQVAVMNGEPTGERTFPGRDPNRAKDVVGRLALAVGREVSKPGEIVEGRAVEVGVEIGISAISGRGFSAGQASSKDVLVWRDDNEDGIVQITELHVLPGQAAVASSSFDRYAIGADLRVIAGLREWGEVVAYGEVIRAQNMDRGTFFADPVAASRNLREHGLMVGVTWEASFGGLAGVRYDRYDPDADAFEQQAGTVVTRDPVVSQTALAAGWRLKGSARALLEYDHETNPYGRDEGGEPTTRADDSLTLRLEGTF